MRPLRYHRCKTPEGIHCMSCFEIITEEVCIEASDGFAGSYYHLACDPRQKTEKND